MESFVEELEWRISLEMYGQGTESCGDDVDTSDTARLNESKAPVPSWQLGLPKPKKGKNTN